MLSIISTTKPSWEITQVTQVSTHTHVSCITGECSKGSKEEHRYKAEQKEIAKSVLINLTQLMLQYHP